MITTGNMTIGNIMIRNITALMAGLAFGAFMAYIWAGTPVVQFSMATGQCVQVIGPGSCDSLPKKYNHEWVR